MAAKKCLICNSPFRGRVDAKTCSPRCRKRLQALRFSLAHDELPTNKPDSWRKAAGLVVLGLFGAFSILLSGTPRPAQALTAANDLDFQGRLLNSSGAVVPDGTYNIDFKIYNADSVTGTVGTCNVGSNCLWEETYLVAASQGVTVTNGYFSVNLNSLNNNWSNAVNWDQQYYLTMNVTTNGTTSCTPRTSCTWNGEMQNGGHSIAMTSVPLAFRANQLAVTGTNEQVLQFANSSFGQTTTISLPDPGATTATVCYQNATACGFAASSGSGSYIQNQSASPQTANFNIQSAATNSVVANLQAASGQTANLLQATDSNGGLLDQIDANGSLSAYSNSSFYALAIPTGFTAGTPTSGGSLTSGQQYFYEISATNVNGESTASSSINKTPTSPNLTVPLSWNKVNGATGYKIYRNTTNSFTSGSLLLTTITNGTTTSYNDTGTATSAGVPINSTAGNPFAVYSQNGTLSVDVNAFGNLITANGIEATGNIGIGTGPGRSSLLSSLFVAGNASSVGSIIRGATSQTGDLQQFL
ncbi:MAG TPA: hypothetical protein VFK97_01660, partial [Candidatus Saccharimonadales bacterium]|nr:hypothetical protein [Candidatus Saccharimonadales bacterium]